MNQKLRDFVSTYKQHPTPEPFLGFFTNPIPGERKVIADYYWRKLERNGSKRITKPRAKRLTINERFLKHYQPKMGWKD